MKKLSLTTLVIITVFSLGTIFLSSCGDHKKTEAQEQTKSDSSEQKSEDMAVAYACPMHPDVTGKEGDTCSKCGMKLEALKETDTTMTK